MPSSRIQRLLEHLAGPFVAAALVTAGPAGCSRTGLDIEPDLTAPIRDAAPDTAEAAVPFDADVVETSPPPDPCADMPPMPCPGGGSSYCVAGHYSACPQRCGACIPGSEQVCFISYCHSWGVQTCAADGLSFGVCIEESPPSACAGVAAANQASAALEQCCIDNGYCCQDQFDLNHDGMTGEPIGQCGGVTCSN